MAECLVERLALALEDAVGKVLYLRVSTKVYEEVKVVISHSRGEEINVEIVGNER